VPCSVQETYGESIYFRPVKGESGGAGETVVKATRIIRTVNPLEKFYRREREERERERERERGENSTCLFISRNARHLPLRCTLVLTAVCLKKKKKQTKEEERARTLDRSTSSQVSLGRNNPYTKLSITSHRSEVPNR